MRIVISAIDLQPGQMGGIESYLDDLIEGLQKHDKKNHYLVLTLPHNDAAIKITSPLWQKQSLKRSIIQKVWNKLIPRDDAFVQRVNDWKPDIVHFPLQVISPKNIHAKTIVSSMDIQHEYYPEYFSFEDRAARKNTFRPALEAADRVIAISQFTKQSLVEKYHIQAHKIRVIYLSYNELLYKPKLSQASHTLDLPQNFFYYPAATWPHKNHAKLLEAFAKISDAHPDIHLVLSGIAKQQTNTIHEQIHRLGLKRLVHLLGYLKREQLPEIYQRAVAMVFPSKFEGFGIPILEAMASGCPVLSANTTSLPEAGGKAVKYFDPDDAESIADGMKEILDKTATREKLIRQGLERAKLFSQAQMSHNTITLYEETYHGK